jgi:hypothetical protein
MEHKTVEQLKRVAEVRDDFQAEALTPMQRLYRWADLLDERPDRRLTTLYGTEYEDESVRNAMRSDESPISVAFQDPALRAAGMKDDTYGEAKRFFEVSDKDLHDVLCYCHYGSGIQAGIAARSVRAIAIRAENPGLMGRVRSAFAL